MNSRHERLEQLFWRASQIDSARQRHAFLQEACDNDQTLRREVEELLGSMKAADELAESFLPTMAVGRREFVGDKIGPYKLREKVGEGGFGVVYVAEQEVPIRRKVALKLIKPGMDSQQVVARFEAERQALALMDHPNIAKVLDASSTADGRPYFVMELVNGIPVTEYAEKHDLPIRERLELMRAVCEAVEHAHKKGIIHRDLKPSNVLVTLHDGQPIIKVIDFGVAKALHQRLTENTVYTAMGQMIGTPMYMSPEQAELSGLDVDTRSDVYALGVLLYELLTGMTPFDPETFRQAGFEAMLNMIRESEPPRPSLRVSTAATHSDRSRIDDRRQVDPQKLSATLKGELDWIVMKALEKQRQRRYQSARELAEDLENFLSNQPVFAGPPTWTYRAKKYCRRHRVGIGIGVAALLILTLATASLAWVKYERADYQRRLVADQERKIQRLGREDERIQQLLDEQRWRLAREGVETILGQPEFALTSTSFQDRLRDLRKELILIEDLETAQLQTAEWNDFGFDFKGADLAFQKAFATFGINIDSETTEVLASSILNKVTHPEAIAAALDHWAIAMMRRPFESLNFYEKQAIHGIAELELGEGISDLTKADDVINRLELASAVDRDPVRASLRSIAMSPMTVERSDALRKFADFDQTALMPTSTLLLLTNMLWQDQQHELAVDVLRNAQPNRLDDFWLNFELSRYLSRQSDYLEAARFLSFALAVRPDSGPVLTNLGVCFHRARREDDAIRYYRRCMRVAPDIRFAWTNLALILTEKENFAEAESILRELLKLDPTHVRAWVALSVNLGCQGETKAADDALSHAYELHREPRYVAEVAAAAYYGLDRFDEAARCLNQAADRGFNLIGDDLLYVGLSLGKLGKDEAAARVLQQSLERKFFARHSRTHAYIELAKTYERLGRDREAKETYLKGIESDEKGPFLHSDLAWLLLKAEDPIVRDLEEAEWHALRSVQVFEGWDKPIHHFPFLVLGDVLEARGKIPDAIAAFKRSRELRSQDPNYLAGRLSKLNWQLGLQTRNRERAAQLLEEALSLQPEHKTYRLDLAKVLRYWVSGGPPQDAKAIQLLRDQLKLHPEDADAASQLARSLVTASDSALRDPEEALVWAELAIERSKRTEVWTTLGLVHFRAGRWQPAKGAFEQAQEAGHESGAPVTLLRSLCAYYLGQQEEAQSLYVLANARFELTLQETGEPPFGRMFIEEYRKAVQLFEHPDNLNESDTASAKELLCLGLAERYAGREREALALFQQGVQLDNSVPWLHDQLARMLVSAADENLRNVELAQQHASLAVQHYEALQFETWPSHGLSLLADGEVDQSRDAFLSGKPWQNHVLSDHLRQHAIARYTEADELWVSGETQQSLEALREGLVIEPESRGHRTTLGMRIGLLDARGNAIAKIRHFQASLAIQPNFAAHDQLSRIYSTVLQPMDRDPERALFHSKQALALYSGEPKTYALGSLGLAHYRCGHWEEAIKAFERSREAPGGNPVVPLDLFLALCLFKQGNVAQAEALFHEFEQLVENRIKEGHVRFAPFYEYDYQEAKRIFSKTEPGIAPGG